jgi:succinoglycan biosynthesis transport protein ExoP
VDLRRLIVLARAWLPLLILSGVLAGTAGFVFSNLQPKVYEAKTTLIVGQALSAANPDFSELLVAQNLSATYATVAKTRPILERLIAELGLDVTPGTLAGRVQVSAPRESTILFITAQDTDPARAAAVANELAVQLIDISPTIQGREEAFQQSIDEDLAATQDQMARTQVRADALLSVEQRTTSQEAELQALEGRMANLRATYTTLLTFSSGTATNLLTVLEPADTPRSEVSPRTLLNTLLAAALGVLLVVAIAFLAEQLDDRIKDPEAVQEVAGLSTLGTIARMTRSNSRTEMYQLAGLLFPRSSYAEAYRTLRTNIEFASIDAPLRTLLVTSSAAGEGKTVTASNLAVVFAQAGRRVLLVDADLRKPGVHVMFDLPNDRGLTTMFRDDHVSLATLVNPTEQDNLVVLTTGPLPANPAELLGSQRMQAILKRLREGADLVIFDSPPLLAVTDAAVMSSYLDGTLLVIDALHGKRRVVRMAREALAKAGAKTMGAVLNRVPAVTRFGYGELYGRPAEADGALVVDVVAERRGTSVEASGPN